MYSVKKLLQKMSQDSQINIYEGHFLVRLQVEAPPLLLKGTLSNKFYLEFSGIFKNSYFVEGLFISYG